MLEGSGQNGECIVPASGEYLVFWAPRAAAIFAAAALICALLIVVLHPFLARYAMALPNARSSHKLPTPQGGGIAVVAVAIAVAGATLYSLPFGPADSLRLVTVAAAVIVIACVGVIADMHPKLFALRLSLQALAVAAIILTLPADLRLFPVVPWWAERIALILGGLWFVNLVNFMDGLDWMTAAEVVPVTGALAAIGLLGRMPEHEMVVSLALCGAVAGFAWFNRPVATLFLGDVGSLPIGLTLGWLLIWLAGTGGRTAALLLPLYYLADSSITLARRALAGEPIWQAHRTHFYQRATDSGFTVLGIVARVFFVNLVLAALALITVIAPGRVTDVAAMIAGALAVAWLLYGFARGPRSNK